MHPSRTLGQPVVKGRFEPVGPGLRVGFVLRREGRGVFLAFPSALARPGGRLELAPHALDKEVELALLAWAQGTAFETHGLDLWNFFPSTDGWLEKSTFAPVSMPKIQ